MDLNIQNTKIELIQWLTTLDDQSMLAKLLELRKDQSTKPEYNLSPAEKQSIEEGLADIKNGNVVPHSEVKKTYEKWL